MGVARMLRSWRSVLQEALPTLHGHQLNGLTQAAWAMIQAGHCQLSKMAVMTPGSATVPSRERRWQRLVANERLDADAALDHWAKWALREVSAVTLFLDETSLAELVPDPGRTWCGQAGVFKKAGWRRVNVVARWSPRRAERWLLVTDLPAEPRRCKQYRKRMRQEQSFRDEKSHGLHWNDSRIRDPAHAQRLLLVMALAMAWLIHLGLRVTCSGQRRRYQRPDRRCLSLFQLGLRAIQETRRAGRPPPKLKCVGW